MPGPKSNPAYDAKIYATVQALNQCGIEGAYVIAGARFGIGSREARAAFKRHERKTKTAKK